MKITNLESQTNKQEAISVKDLRELLDRMNIYDLLTKVVYAKKGTTPQTPLY
jgi:hypothetical protein